MAGIRPSFGRDKPYRLVALAALAVVCLFLFAAATLRAAPAVPPLTGPVIDVANLLTSADRDRLEGLARAARAEQDGQGVQLQFLIIPSLEGTPIEDYSIHVAETWKIGSSGKDNGILFVVSRDDRKVRIEVGAGLEGGLTDAQAGRIIRQTIAPAFRTQRYGDGLYDAAVQALAALGALPQGIAAPPSAQSPRSTSPGLGLGLLFLVLLFVLLAHRMGGFLFWPMFLGGLGAGRGGGRSGGGWSSGGWGGGGGGWGGGGGGFSGGGASGGW